MKNTKNMSKELDLLDFDEDLIPEKPSKKKKKQQKKEKKLKKRQTRSANPEILTITYIFLAFFLILAGYFIYFLAVEKETYVNSAYNSRLSLLADKVIRGDIITSDGLVVATNEYDEEGNETRVYPYGRTYAHAVGYSVNGMAGVELDANSLLLTSHSSIQKQLAADLKGEKTQGDSVVITLDSKLQEVAYNNMGYDGALIAIEPSTGKILAMVSKPNYDPNVMSDLWDELVDTSDSRLLNRVTQGLYPPGSTFKIVTLLEYYRENGTSLADTYNCNGTYTSTDGFTIHCVKSHAHGQQNALEAFGNSCNVVFSQIGLGLDRTSFTATAEELLFNQELPTKLSNVKSSSFSLDDASSDELVMQTAIGQGDTLVTPLHMALLASAICNDGQLMEPYLIDHVQNDEGITVSSTHETSAGNLMTEEEAAALQYSMRYVVTSGTASKLDTDAYEAYGKTGSAQYTSDLDQTHSWFVGYAKSGGKEIAIAVIQEGAGTGSSCAVPLAKLVFDQYFAD